MCGTLRERTHKYQLKDVSSSDHLVFVFVPVFVYLHLCICSHVFVFVYLYRTLKKVRGGVHINIRRWINLRLITFALGGLHNITAGYLNHPPLVFVNPLFQTPACEMGFDPPQ